MFSRASQISVLPLYVLQGLTNTSLTSVCSQGPHKHQSYPCMFSRASQTSVLPLYVLQGLQNISLTTVCSPGPHKHQSYICMFSRASQTSVLSLYVLQGLTNISLTSVCSPGLTNISLTPVCSPGPQKHQSYLCMFSRACVTTVRGFLTWCRRLGCRRGRQRFHWVTQPACITPGGATLIAFVSASLHFWMAASLTCRTQSTRR